MYPLRANRIKQGLLKTQRPGIIHPFMQPTKLKNQSRAGSQKTNLMFSPQGNTLVGGAQWAVRAQRPGLAKPMIMAKQEKRALIKGLAIEAKVAKAKAPGKGKGRGKSQGKALGKPKTAGLSNYFGAYGSYDY